MKYKCIKELWLPKYDADCFNTENYDCVSVGSLWEISDDNIIGGEIHLEPLGDNENFGWIEITSEDLKEFFEKTK